MNVLCIGNSFSLDATRYLHQIARADNVQITVINLYIGGCSLERHFRNMMGDAPEYEIYVNGHATGFFASIKEALLSRKWDIITMQQVSRQSVDFSTFQPFLNELAAYVRKHAPTAQLVLHQTWAYEPGCELMTDSLGYPTHEAMYLAVQKAYEQAAVAINANFVIPSGTLFNMLFKHGMQKLHRDPIHATYGAGRYALGLLWYKCLTGNDISSNTFCDFDENITVEDIALIKQCVAQIP